MKRFSLKLYAFLPPSFVSLQRVFFCRDLWRNRHGKPWVTFPSKAQSGTVNTQDPRCDCAGTLASARRSTAGDRGLECDRRGGSAWCEPRDCPSDEALHPKTPTRFSQSRVGSPAAYSSASTPMMRPFAETGGLNGGQLVLIRHLSSCRFGTARRYARARVKVFV
jgi:hypothetical protein